MRRPVLLLLAASPWAAPGSTVRSVQTDVSGATLKPQAPLEWQAEGHRSGRSAVGGGLSATLEINRTDVRQAILGFGAAFTETAGYNFHLLSSTTRKKLADILWAPPPTGNGYSMGRLHMNSADYSLSSYSLDDTAGDWDLRDFDDGIARDQAYVLPLVRAAKDAALGGEIKLFFSPWSPPAWLKKNGAMIDTEHPNGLVEGDQARKTWANYFVRYARALKAAGFPAWGATLQNEPLMDMSTASHDYEACAWTVDAQAKFLETLGEALTRENDSDVRSLKLFGWDWNRKDIANWTETLLASPGGKYLAGVSHHWYAWRHSLLLDEIEKLPRGTVSFGAEASLIKAGIALRSSARKGANASWGVLLDTVGVQQGIAIAPGSDSVRLTYAVGELYLLDILGTLRAGSSGWVEWNAFLDYNGGPNHINRTDIGAQVIIDPATDSVFMQSPFYYMGHLSRFVPAGSYRVACRGEGIAETSKDHDDVKDFLKPLTTEDPEPASTGTVPLVAGCFVNDQSVTVVVMNVNSAAADFSLHDADFGYVTAALPAHSVRTFTYSSERAATIV